MAQPAPPPNLPGLLGAADCRRDAQELARELERMHVRVIAVGPQRLRLVTHLEITDEQVELAIQAFARAAS